MIDQPRTFPPKMFYLVIWILTLGLGVFGVVVSPKPSTIFFIWLVVALVAIRQIWTTRWVQIDQAGIRVRNIAQRGRDLQWEAIEKIEDREIPVRKERSFRVIKIMGEMTGRPGRATTIILDSDTVGFNVLIDILHGIVPEGKIEKV